MYGVISSRKMENGIVVFWDQGDERKYESFNYQELLDMKVNMLDLLDRPHAYHIDPAAHLLVPRK